MFEQTFVPQPNRTRSGGSLIVSFAAQIGVIGLLILIPLVYTEALPRAQINAMLTAPLPPPPPPPPPPPVHEVVVKRAARQFDKYLLAPKTIPKTVAIIQEDDLPPALSTVGVAGSVPGVPGGANPTLTSLIGREVSAAPPAPVVKDPPKPVTQRIRVGGSVIQASLIKRVVPQYPPLAVQARVQGTVRFTAIIGKDGTIQNLQLISGHPLLVRAAREAITQWVYKPTILNTEPVEVITQIDFTFTLSQ